MIKKVLKISVWDISGTVEFKVYEGDGLSTPSMDY